MSRDWTAGGVFVLRHAGLPFDLIEGLGAPPDLLAATENLLEREEALLTAAPAAGVPEARLRVALAAAEPDRLPISADPGWCAAAELWQEALRGYRKTFEEAEEQASEQLRETLRRPDVQEAVFLSNPDVYRNMLVPFLAGPRPLNSKWRRVRRQLYTYLQRFCAKNETVSFFGPMAYGTLTPGRQVRLRTDTPRRRRVFLAHWAAKEIADSLARDRRLRAVLPFRGTGAPAGVLPAGTARLLAAVGSFGPDGAPLPRIAGAAGLEPKDAAVGLRSLVAAGLVEFGIAAAPYDLDPLETILDRLALPVAAGAAGEALAEWTARLTVLRTLLAELQSRSFPGRMETVERLERAFTELTGRPARRGAGAVYADRAVFYEECASPFALEVGEEALRTWCDRMTAALELSVAHGAAAQRVAEQQVCSVIGESLPLPLPAYAEGLLDALNPGGSRFVPDHVRGYPATWAEEVTEDLLRDASRLPGDRYALVDLCLATDDPDQLATADLVLSRCHHHLLTPGWLGEMYTGAGEFGADAGRWSAERPDVVGLDVGRRNKGYYRFPGRRVVLRAPSASDAGDPAVLWPGQVTVERNADGLRCLDPSGREISLYLPLSDYVKYPPYAALSHPQVFHAVFDGTADIPPVSVGEVVYQRARWELDPAALAGGTTHARYLRLRRLARSRVPERFVFCRTPRERKPYLLDLASVLAADLVAHIAKDGLPVTAEQMRPGPDELWLRDERGDRYTCELRMQVVGRERVA